MEYKKNYEILYNIFTIICFHVQDSAFIMEMNPPRMAIGFKILRDAGKRKHKEIVACQLFSFFIFVLF